MAVAKYVQEQIFNCLKNVSPEQFNEFLTENNIHIPRDAQKLILMNVIDENIDSYYDDLSDETKYKLQNGLDDYTVRQLENLLKKGIKIDPLEYMQGLMAFIMNYHSLYNLFERHFVNYCEENKDGSKQNFSYDVVKDLIEHIFFDRDNQFDGVDIDIVRESLYNYSTTAELRRLAKEYNVVLPRRINKDQIKEHIVNMLTKRGEMVDETLHAYLDKLSIMKLEQFAKSRNIKVSLELRKEEIIVFILEYRPVLLDIYNISEKFSKIETFLGKLYDDEATKLIRRVNHKVRSRKRNKKSILDDLVVEVFEVVEDKPNRKFLFFRRKEKPKKEKRYIKKKETDPVKAKKKRRQQLLRLRRKKAKPEKIKKEKIKKTINIKLRKKVKMYITIFLLVIAVGLLGFMLYIYYSNGGNWGNISDFIDQLFNDFMN